MVCNLQKPKQSLLEDNILNLLYASFLVFSLIKTVPTEQRTVHILQILCAKQCSQH